MKDEYGNEYLYVDEDMRLRLETKLIHKAKDAAKPRRGRPARADKAAPDKAKPQPRDKMELLTKEPPEEKIMVK